MKSILSAVFEDRAQVEQALTELRERGIPDDAISVVAHHSEDLGTGDVEVHDLDDHSDRTSGIVKGALTGAGLGALFGLVALAIPGAGPFITAGALAQALGVTGGAVASGAIVGGTAGGLSALLLDFGVGHEDAAYYEERLHQGAVFVAVDIALAPQNEPIVREIFQRTGGRSSAYMA